MRRLGMNDGSCNENMPGLPGPLSNIPQFAAQPIRLEVIVFSPESDIPSVSICLCTESPCDYRLRAGHHHHLNCLPSLPFP